MFYSTNEIVFFYILTLPYPLVYYPTLGEKKKMETTVECYVIF